MQGVESRRHGLLLVELHFYEFFWNAIVRGSESLDINPCRV